jgi:hypothetical protein
LPKKLFRFSATDQPRDTGTKLYSAMMSDRVAFEANDHTVAVGWSVIIKGGVHLLSATTDLLDAEEAPLLPWIATLKPCHARVMAEEITGRRFKFGPEPGGPGPAR